jgi:hypothetical protein
MKFRPQSIALFLAGSGIITSVASQQADSSVPLVVNSTSACSSIPYTLATDYPQVVAFPQLPFIEDCLASIPVDKDNMIKHIHALNKMFAQT